jgi:rod shape determining protein RodA
MEQIFWHLKRMDWYLVFLISLLFLIGCVEIFSISKNNFFDLKKQIIFFAVGFFLMILVSFFDWRILRENSFLILGLYVLSLILLFLVLFFPETRGRKGWFEIGFFSFDPAQITKISLLILLSKYFSTRHKELYNLKHIFISGFFVILPALLIFKQPDFGFFSLILFLWISILIFSGIKIRHFILIVLIFVILFSFFWEKILKPYQKERLLSFLKIKSEDPLKVDWSQRQAKIAIASGGLFGKGIKQGFNTQSGFLSEAKTDFIFSAIIEEMGFLGISVLLLLYFLLFWHLFKFSFSLESNFAKLFCQGFLAILFFEFFLHVATNLSLIPVIGFYLPFVSYGGSAILANFICVGIFQSFKVRS